MACCQYGYVMKKSLPVRRGPSCATRLALGLWLALVPAASGGAGAQPGDLPPDPGPAGQETLGGTDSDGDGLRDDIQRWIALNYADSARWRAALAQAARTLQRTVAQADASGTARANFAAMARDFSCITHVAWRTDETWRTGQRPGMAVLDLAMDTDARLRAEVLNTDMRQQAFRQFQGNVPGGVLERPNLADGAKACDFDPEALPD